MQPWHRSVECPLKTKSWRTCIRAEVGSLCLMEWWVLGRLLFSKQLGTCDGNSWVTAQLCALKLKVFKNWGVIVLSTVQSVRHTPCPEVYYIDKTKGGRGKHRGSDRGSGLPKVMQQGRGRGGTRIQASWSIVSWPDHDFLDFRKLSASLFSIHLWSEQQGEYSY